MKKIKLLGILVLGLFSVINLSAGDLRDIRLDDKDFTYLYNMKTGICEYRQPYEREAFNFITGSMLWKLVTEPLEVPDGKIIIIKSVIEPRRESLIFATTMELCEAAIKMGTR